jgi:glycosyltransferase involved in cell wall biosynthesis
VKDATLLVGTVGSLTAIKRHDLLIQSLASLGDVRRYVALVIVGDGPEGPALGALADRLGLAGTVIFAGRHRAVPAVLPALDVYACASDFECCSNAILEAMAAGLPIVATDVGGNAELLGGGEAGMLVPPGSAGDLAGALSRLAADPGLRRRFGSAARGRAERFRLDRCVQGYAAFYRTLVTGGRECAPGPPAGGPQRRPG